MGKGIFLDCEIYCLSKKISTKQRDILHKAIEKNGGTWSTNVSDQITHLIVEDLAELEEFKSFLSSAKIVTVKWIQDSLRLQKRQHEKNYAPTLHPSYDEESTEKKIETASPVGREKKRQKTLPINPPSTGVQKLNLPFYACMRYTSDRDNKNTFLTGIFNDMEGYYKSLGDETRALAYRHVLALLKAAPFRIESIEQIRDVPLIGDKMLLKIQSLLTKGTFYEYEQLKTKEAQVLMRFTTIYGVGARIAKKWYAQGLETIDDIMKASEKGTLSPKLNGVQTIGLLAYNDMQVPISAEDQHDIMKYIKQSIDAIDPEMICLVCGGIRRKKLGNSHDMDILVRVPKKLYGKEKEVLRSIKKHLEEQNLLEYTLTISVRRNKQEVEENDHPKYYGLCNLHNGRPLRRIDIIVVPYKEWWFAVLGWSGSTYFERSLRLYAQKEKNIHLTNYGLQTYDTKEPIEWHGNSEEEIFTALHLQYIPPEGRCC